MFGRVPFIGAWPCHEGASMTMLEGGSLGPQDGAQPLVFEV